MLWYGWPNSPETALYGPEINGNPTVYIGDLTFEIRERAVRHVIEEEITPAWTNLNLHQVGDPI